jgi:hypothetical protein
MVLVTASANGLTTHKQRTQRRRRGPVRHPFLLVLSARASIWSECTDVRVSLTDERG